MSVDPSLATRGRRERGTIPRSGRTCARNRRDVRQETVERLGLPPADVVVADDWSADAARRAVVDLPPDSDVTAVVCANDRLAAGAVRGASERGWRVPERVSITGWDNDDVAAIMPPSITTVAIDFHGLGRRAIHLLVAALRDEPAPAETGSLMQILWRESTGRRYGS